MTETTLTQTATHYSTTSDKQVELLIFTLKNQQDYAVDIFKTREIITLQKLNCFPGMHESIIGVTTIRNHTLPIIDLGYILSGQATQETAAATLIITISNNHQQALLVHQVKHITCISRDAIHPAEKSLGSERYITATAQIEGKLVQLIDIERILNTIKPSNNSNN